MQVAAKSGAGLRHGFLSRGFFAVSLALMLAAPAAIAADAKAAGGKRVAASRPAAPTVALVITGDTAIAAPMRDVIGAFAQEQGFQVIEGRNRGDHDGVQPDPRPFARKADAVFYIEAMPVGATEVEYYGNVSTLYSVQMAISAYRPGDGRRFWSVPAQSVDFTALNAREKAQETIEPLLADIEQELRRLR